MFFYEIFLIILNFEQRSRFTPTDFRFIRIVLNEETFTNVFCLHPTCFGTRGDERDDAIRSTTCFNIFFAFPLNHYTCLSRSYRDHELYQPDL